MATLENRSGSALLVVDVQNDVVTGAHERDAVVANIAALVERARGDGVPVIWVQHSDDGLVQGSDGWQIVPELTPADGETRIDKHHGDSFEDTTLEAALARRGIGRLIVVGAQTDACIRSTIHGGFVRGYDVTLVSDGHTTEDLSAYGAPSPGQVIAHTNLCWAHHSGVGRTAAVVETSEVDFGPGILA